MTNEALVRHTLLIVAALLVPAGAPLQAQAPKGERPEVMDCNEMEPEQFERLPDTRAIRCGGEEKTVGEIRLELEAKRQRVQAQRRQAQTATSGELAEIQREAVRLRQRMQTARTPEEKAEIEAKANDFLKELVEKGMVPKTTHDWGDITAVLCEAVDCGDLDLIVLPPWISGVLPFSVVSPEGPIFLFGQFGPQQGKLWLKGSFGTREMAVDSWDNAGIGAVFPSASAIGPISDSNLTLQVEKPGGLTSNEWPLQWVQEVRLLESGNVTVLNCGEGANVNSCNWQLQGGSNCAFASDTTSMVLDSKPPDSACPCTAVGFHGNCWGAVTDDGGADTYLIGPLKNGWTLASFTFHDSLPKNDSCDDAVKPPGFQAGDGLWVPSISWCVTSGDSLFYRLWIYIVGPKGFPHI